MLKFADSKNICKAAIKKILADPLSVGCEDKQVRIIESDEVLNLGHNVNSISGYSGVLCMGCQNGSVKMKKVGEELVEIYSHSSNVCSLDMNDKNVLSGSWDHEAILYDYNTNEECKKRSFRHPGSVWCVQLLENSKFITGCADNKIRMFGKDGISAVLSFHTSPVRGIVCDGSVLFSIENHGKVHKASLDGRLLAARDVGTFLYCICKYEDLVVLGGEGGCIFVCNESLEIIECLKTGCSAIWDVKQSGDTLYAAGSNGCLLSYKLSSHSSFEGEVNQESEAVQEGSINEADEPESKEEPKKATDNNSNRTFISGGVKYKTEDDKIYVEKGDQWELLGYTSQKYDHSIPVEFGNKSYTLSFNDSDNVHDVASNFIRQNKLSQEFHDDIVEHIQKNFKQNTNYKKYDTIEIGGVEKVLGDHPIVYFIKRVMNGSVYSKYKSDEYTLYQLEEILYSGDYPEIPLFVKFDILKFFIGKGMNLDVSFLLESRIVEKKEARALVLLMTNLVRNPPFNLEGLDRTVRRLVDSGLLSSKDTHYYEENKRVKARESKN